MENNNQSAKKAFARYAERQGGCGQARAKISEREGTCQRRTRHGLPSSVKFILDALVVHKILTNDTRRWVDQVYHRVVDSDESGAVVYIMTREEWEAAKYQLI